MTDPPSHPLDRLFATIESRRDADPERSYTAALLRRGPAKLAQKVGEEAVETLIEGVRGDRHRLAAESADLLYHLLVLWAATGIRPEAVWEELAAREARSGLAGRPDGDHRRRDRK